MKHAIRYTIIASSLLIALVMVSAQESKLQMDSYIEEQMAKLHIPGTAVAVVRNGKVELMKGYGLANVEQKTAVTPNTMFQIASTTKPFTAMAIMMLAEEGKVSLDEKAIKYLPWLPSIDSDITVRQLLAHTSGVMADLRTGNVDNFTIDEFKKRVAQAPLAFKPNERWEYANTGYILLGMIIEAVSGTSYGEFLTQRIFKPLGMNNTAYNEAVGNTNNRALGYDWQNDGFRQSPYFAGGYGAGALVSSVSDLTKWEQALSARKLLKPSSYEQMWTPVKLSNGQPRSFEFRAEQSGYGFGWFLTSYKGHKLFTHGGTLSGFSSQIMRFVDDKISIIVMTNSKSGADRIGYAEVLAKGIAALIFADSSSGDKDAEKIRELVQQWDNALVKKDAAFIDGILTDDFTYISSSGQIQSKSQLLRSVKSTDLTIESSDSNIFRVSVYGDTAVVIAEGMVKGRYKSDTFVERYRYTDVWVRQNGNWKATVTQVTGMPSSTMKQGASGKLENLPQYGSGAALQARIRI
jgi:CubicO group peptidase (beta-lactamase class C family)